MKSRHDQENRSYPKRIVSALARLLHSQWPWLALLAFQFALVQLLLGVQYGDGPRNLHWAMLAVENPGFLVGDSDPYDMVNGFVPDPPELAPAGNARTTRRPLHRWWGPVPLVLMGAVWWLTGSRTLMVLVVPVAAGTTVLACYGLGSWLFDRRTGFLAAVFVGLFPLFYQFGVVSYSEAISTLLLLLTLMSYLRRWTGLTVLFGVLTVLSKLDMGPVYCGIMGCSLFYRLCFRRERRDIVQNLVVLSLPVLVLMGWTWLRHGTLLLATGGGQSLRRLLWVGPNILEMLFYVKWYWAVMTLAVIGVCAVVGLRSPRLEGERRVVLAGWVAAGVAVTLVYAMTPGSSNSPRVMLPSLPALGLLVAEGWMRLPRPWARRIGFYLVSLFLAINGFITYYDVEQVRYARTFTDAWQVLREQPRGFVLVSAFWPTLWQTRQPVTWFEFDSQFQVNILHNRDNFVRYTTQHPVRYVLVPRAGTAAAVSKPFIQVEAANLYGDDVLQYLREQAQHIPVPPYYDVYVLLVLPEVDSPD